MRNSHSRLGATAYEAITDDGSRGYLVWLAGGATTLWEMWDGRASKNHHMHSDFMGWLIKNLVGINLDRGRHTVSPRFLPQLSRCCGSRVAGSGRLEVEWQRTGSNAVVLEITVPEGVSVEYGGKALAPGKRQVAVAT